MYERNNIRNNIFFYIKLKIDRIDMIIKVFNDFHEIIDIHNNWISNLFYKKSLTFMMKQFNYIETFKIVIIIKFQK